ncbi:MAG TPA: tetratricopeptide repeat protein [Candidatus Dormibacteraeota bacterium]
MRRDSEPATLSRREREVAELVAEGLTDRDIAGRLFLSVRTVEGHVQHIRDKLDLDTRAAIASWWTRSAIGSAPGDRRHWAPPPNNLPEQLTTFIGRQHDLAEAMRLLQRTRLLTIAGPGGCGKTRLAIRAAGDALHRYPAGAWFVDLTAVVDGGVPRAVGAALDVSEADGAVPLEAIAAELRSARRRGPCLIVLDNCEHLVGDCAATVDALLRANRQLSFLCTSREPLHLAGEVVWRIGPLSVPDPDEPASAASVATSDAVELFLDRVGYSDPTFALDDANASDVAHLCRRLDGIPLALVLAAARVGLMPFRQLVMHLDARIPRLDTYGSPSRQQTLSAAFAWSYDLLTEPERRVLRTLSVFSGSFTHEAVDAVRGAGEPGEPEALALVTLLADKSLVEPLPPDRARYRCLEIVRQHAWELLRSSGELDEAYGRFVEHFLGFAEEAAARLSGPSQTFWLERLAADHDNVRTALALSHGADPVRRLGLVVALSRFWRTRGHVTDGRAFAEDVLGSVEGMAPTPLLAHAVNVAAGLAWDQGDTGRADAWLRRSLAIWQDLGDRKGVQFCLGNLALIACARRDWEAARGAFAESLATARDMGDEGAIGLVLCNLGPMLAHLGEHEAALAHLSEALAILHRQGDPVRVAMVLANLGMGALFRGHDDEAREHYRASLATLRDLGARRDLAESLEGMACLAARRRAWPRALRLAGAAAQMRETMGTVHSPFTQRLLDEWLDQARMAHGEAAARRAWDEGAGLSEDAAIALALDDPPVALRLVDDLRG